MRIIFVNDDDDDDDDDNNNNDNDNDNDNNNNKHKGKHKHIDWINLWADNRNKNLWVPGKVSVPMDPRSDPPWTFSRTSALNQPCLESDFFCP